ncbi:MAG: hypothetical protein QY331_07565 [Melioribacteraceae bacterium]|nr:MAG: hypothetical protein QY331_07565 [Melioribacteraceae bacterium]
MSESNKNILDIMKFIFSIVISILVAALGYMMTNKLEAIENQLERINTAINKQMVINNTVEYKIEDHEKRIGKLEDEE